VKPGLVGSSDLSRARRTAELLATETGYEATPLVDPALREQDLGDWNGLSRAEIKQRWPSELAKRDLGGIGDVPGGETGAAFAERCLGALERFAATLFEAGEEVAVTVTHGGVVIALEHALDCWRAGVGHPNLSGWWLDVIGTGGLADMVVRERVELKDPGVENATRSL
jgi:broad specificity phosphatase PhoE